ncbi:MAG: hypothetical protein M4579_006336 [Chaenotheca gracillima]|nr:MAG: hypothetical protein M4579_006336 [Chaenotheca gracillima]
MVNQRSLSALEQRLARMEQRTLHGSSGDETSPGSTTGMLPPSVGRQTMPLSNSQLISDTPPERDRPIASAHVQPSMNPPPESSMVVSADPDVFMGGVSFTRLILNAMNGRPMGLQAQSFGTNRDEPFPVAPADIFELPYNTTDLLRQFFDFRHRLSPIFHEPTIWAMFDAAINCEVSGRHHHRYTLAIMNMIFAICSSNRLSDVDTNPAISRRYYDISMQLLQPTLLRDGSLEKVQALLLGTRYLQSSNSPEECWNVLGLAVRIAYGLELHRPPPEEDGFNLKETKKRVWYACFTLDKLLSMIYGRPSAIDSSEANCPLPEDLDDDCIYPHRLLYPTPKRASTMSFSIEVAKLYRILESATHLNTDMETASGELVAQSVMSLDEKYQKWYRELPPELILDGNNDHEQPLILALRANMVRMLIHRQSLALTLRGLSDSAESKRVHESVKSSILQYSRNICVNAAMETINVVGLRHEQSQKAAAPSWFNLYYLFNAILILVSEVIDVSYKVDKTTLACLDSALNMIKSMSSDHSFAQRAYSFLQQLLTYVNKSLAPNGGRTNWDLAPPPNHPRHSASSSQPVRVNGGMGMQSNQVAEEVPPTDLFALFDFTQDLTEHLGSHLETYETMGSGMWSWSEEQGPVRPRVDLDGGNFAPPSSAPPPGAS